MDSKTADEMAAGGPGIVTLGGTDYLCAPVDDKKFFAMRAYVKSKLKTPVQAVAEAVKDLPPALRAEALKAAVAQQAGGSEVTEEAAHDIILSRDGCRFIAWLHMQPPLNPDLTREKLNELITDDTYLDVFGQLDDATGLSKLVKAEGERGNRSGRRG